MLQVKVVSINQKVANSSLGTLLARLNWSLTTDFKNMSPHQIVNRMQEEVQWFTQELFV